MTSFYSVLAVSPQESTISSQISGYSTIIHSQGPPTSPDPPHSPGYRRQQYQYTNFLSYGTQGRFEVYSELQISLNLNIFPNTPERRFGLMLNNSAQTQITAHISANSSHLSTSEISAENILSIGAYLQLEMDTASDFGMIYIPISEENGFNDPALNYRWFYFTEGSEWEELPTEIDQIDGESEDFLFGDITTLTQNSSSSITVTVAVIPAINQLEAILQSPFFIIGGLIILGFAILMSMPKYREYLLNRVIPLSTTPHRLTMAEVLENENRDQIIRLVLENPGIHFNELLRKMEISAGNLAWHLDILETFKVIYKQRVGQFLVYFPYLEKNPLSKLELKLQKSQTTLEILQLLGDHPDGMFQSQIARRMDLNHKTVKYHLEKLIDADIIKITKEGRRIRYFPA